MCRRSSGKEGREFETGCCGMRDKFRGMAPRELGWTANFLERD